MIPGLYARYLRNDLRQNRGVTVAVLIMLILSSFLMAGGAIVLERLAGSVDRLFQDAKPPHFLQMHKGDYDMSALEDFAAEHNEIDSWLIEEMVAFDGARIMWERPATAERGDLSSSLIDNLFVSQNSDFDFLLDEQGKPPQPDEGTIYVPVAYSQQYDIRAGDQLSVHTETGLESFEVAGFVRDAQMGSSMSSATRFLVSDTDLQHLGIAGGGTPEIIVEYRLSDNASLDAFQRAYESDPELPKNGQAVTEVMIQIVTIFSDGLVAVAFMFASLLLIGIALLNVRFIIRGTLQDEIHEIGAMKAIGLPDRMISGLYLTRYSLLALIACVIGGALAATTATLLTGRMQTNLAQAPVTVATVLVPLVALGVVYVIVVGICAITLRRVRKIEVVGALVHGSTASQRQTRRIARRQRRHRSSSALTGAHGNRLNLRLALLDLRAEARQWILVPAVFCCTAILITVPLNLLSTFESARFVTYLGAPERDLRADVGLTSGTEESADVAHQTLRNRMLTDPRISTVESYAGQLYEVQGEEAWETLRVEAGDYAETSLAFVEGSRPQAGQIALSVLNAEKLELHPGDTFQLRNHGTVQSVVLSGTYQDVTAGGYTAKLQDTDLVDADTWTIYADLTADNDPVSVASEYDAQNTAVSVLPMQQYVTQTMSYVTDALRGTTIITLVFGIGAAALITTLFVRLQLNTDRHKMGVLSVVGFSLAEIFGQVLTKIAVSVVLGIALGMLFTATLGESLISAMLSAAGFGIVHLTFIPQPVLAYVLYPALLFAAGVFGALILLLRRRGADRSQWLK